MVGCTNIKEMFKGCTSLESLPAGLFDKMTSITATASAFYGCTGFTGESPLPTAEVEGAPVKVHLYDRPDYPDLFVKVPTKESDYKDTFKNCTKMADLCDDSHRVGAASATARRRSRPSRFLLCASREHGYHGINFTVKGTEFKSEVSTSSVRRNSYRACSTSSTATWRRRPTNTASGLRRRSSKH